MPNPFAALVREMQPQASLYKGAAFDRLNYDWVMQRLSADMTIRFDLQTLRNRARELVINNSSAAAVPAIFSENVVGKDGILMQPQAESSRGTPHKTDNPAIDEWWQDFSESPTAEGRATMVDFQRMTVETEATDGEVLIRMIDGFDNAFGFAVQVFDADQLDIYYNVTPGPGQNAIKMGVEQDAWGRPLFYHLWTAHPTDPQGKERIAVPAKDIIHLFIQRRPAQSRGVPWMAPVVVDLKMLGGYRESELVASRASAAKMGFVETSQDVAPPSKPREGARNVKWEANPGTIERLGPGETFKDWDPKHPTTAFDHFDKAILRSIASALRVSYISLSGDLNNTSFSSGRVGMLAERAVYQAMQQRIVRKVLTPIYRRALRMSLLSGALSLSSLDERKYWNVTWHPRAFPWIDPVKDISEKEHLVGMGASSITRICKETGVDFEQIMKERKAEIELAEQYGVPLIIAEGQSSRAVNVDTTAESEADEGKPPEDGSEDESDDEPPKKNGKPKALVMRRLTGGMR